MKLKNIKVGFAVTGSHCTLESAFSQIEMLIKEGAEIIPIISDSVKNTDTRFGTSEKWLKKIKEITKKDPILTISEAEPIGPKNLLDVLVIAPCTGNTLGKLANGITDSNILMAAKANLRNKKPIVLAVSTNDGLGFNAKNIGLLLNSKNIYFVPFGQDDPYNKSNSLIADMTKLVDTICNALENKQIQPILCFHS